MYKIQTTNQFEKDVVKCCKRGFKIENFMLTLPHY